MDDLLTLIIAIIIGLLSLFTGRKRTPPPSQQRPQTSPRETELDTEVDWETAEEAQSDWDRPIPQERPTRSENAELSPLDVIGKILTGDIEDLLQTKRPVSPRIETEYIDPVQSHASKPLKSHFEVDTLTSAANPESEELRYPELSDPAALRQAIRVREILDRPLAKRNRRRSLV